MSWTLIESQTLGASAASVTLGSGGTIPQTYKTLKIVVSARTDGTNGTLLVKPNNNGSNYSVRRIDANGASAGSQSYTSAYFAYACKSTDTSSTFASNALDIPNYAGATNKPISADSVTENNGTTAQQDLSAGLWSDTTAITSIVIAPAVDTNLVSGSTFTLYGLK